MPVNKQDVYIFGGWYGVLGQLLRDNTTVGDIYSVDIDPECAEVINNSSLDGDRIFPVTSDMVDYHYNSDPFMVINTSCEHLLQEEYDRWWNKIPAGTYFVLQGNNFVIDEHVRVSESLDHFTEQCKLTPEQILSSEELQVDNNFTRYMIIGFKNGAR